MPLRLARERLIVALDVPNVADARQLISRLGASVSFYKVGMELIYAGGLDLVRELAESGKEVFVDLKLHDIPNTVERAAAQIAKLGARFLTVHGFSQTMKAAKQGVSGSNLQLLAVTVMTSYDDADLIEAGYAFNVKDLVARRGAQAKAIVIDGLILSPEELETTRAQLGPAMLLVTPGIRPAGAEIGDQKRIMTPGRAVLAGANHIVVGRPVTQSADPKAAADAIVGEVARALETGA